MYMKKIKTVFLIHIIIRCMCLFSNSPKDLYPSLFINCERLIFAKPSLQSNEIFYCYTEFNNKQRYLRFIGLKENVISYNIQLRLDVDPDVLEYIKIDDNALRFIVNGIEGMEDYYLNLQDGSYKIINKKTHEEFWKEFGRVPFKKDFINSTGEVVVLSPFSIRINNIEKQGIFSKQENQYFFATDEKKYIVLFTSLYNTNFLFLVDKSSDNKPLYCNDTQLFYQSSLVGYAESPKLKGVQIKNVEDYITEIDSKKRRVEFKPSDTFDLTGTPWAVNSKSEYKNITIRVPEFNRKSFPIKYLIFVNGFVNAEKSYLFNQNSRVKGMKIETKSFSFETELEDSGNLQLVKLPEDLADEEIIVRVLSKYDGTKYSDIVLSGIYYFVPLKLNQTRGGTIEES